jgi:hypothetical protein
VSTTVRTARIALAQACIQEYGQAYRNAKRQLSAAEVALYEASKRVALKTLLPAEQAREAIRKYEQELADERARAEAARLERERKKAAAAVITPGGASVTN